MIEVRLNRFRVEDLLISPVSEVQIASTNPGPTLIDRLAGRTLGVVTLSELFAVAQGNISISSEIHPEEVRVGNDDTDFI